MRLLFIRMGKYIATKLSRTEMARVGYSMRDVLRSSTNKVKTMKAYGKTIGEKIRKNPYLEKLLTHAEDSPEYQKAHKMMSDKELPSLNAIREISEKMNIKNPKVLVQKMIESPQEMIGRLEALPQDDQDSIAIALEKDIEEKPLSSSWLAYGSFVSSREGSNKGKMIITTKDGTTFETPEVHKRIWIEMSTQIGVTRYDKHGKRKGASYGAGTILHKYVPRNKWKKVKHD